MGLVLQGLYYLIEIYSMALIGYILMSWFPNARETSIGQFLEKICEPYLEPFRKFIPPLGMIDLLWPCWYLILPADMESIICKL